MFKNQKGITLIALVITIIVLLILAGITIALITNNDSAPNKAAEAKVIQDVGAAKDAITVNAAELMTKFYEDKYVKNLSTNTATAQSYITAAANTSKANSTGLFKNITGATIVDEISSNKFVVKSATTVSHTVNNVSTSEYYWVEGEVQLGGTIKWSNGAWGASKPSFTYPN